jgi:two-component system chemotaxis response regulator CheB
MRARPPPSAIGGVEALIAVLGAFPERCPPTVITQHMPALFTKPFSARLDRLCAPRVQEAWNGAPLEPGTVYVAPGGKAHLTVRGKPGALRCHLVESDPVNGHRPSVDVLFSSVAAATGAKSAGVILTGMGQFFEPWQAEKAAGALDGVDGAEYLTEQGGIIRVALQ